MNWFANKGENPSTTPFLARLILQSVALKCGCARTSLNGLISIKQSTCNQFARMLLCWNPVPHGTLADGYKLTDCASFERLDKNVTR